MNTPTTTPRPSDRGASARATTMLLAGILLAWTSILPACKKAPPPPTGAASPAPGAAGAPAKDGHAAEIKLTPESIARYGITVAAAQKHTLRPTIITPARVAFNAEATAHIGSPLRGRVVEIKARLGQSVKKGDELCTIESPELGEAQTELTQKRVAKESAGPAVDLARSSWDRAKGLYEQSQGTSLTEVQRREAEYKGAVAAQRGAEAAVTAAENRLHLLGMNQAAVDAFLKTGEVAPRHTIRAPIDGEVIEREVTLGELVGPDRAQLMVLADLTSVWVLADVPEMHLHELAVGSKAWVRVGPSDAAPIQGQVAYISPKVDLSTRTAQVRIEVTTKDSPITPGMFAQVEIETKGGAADAAPVVAVPEVAVQTVEGASVVFVPVKGEPNTFTKRVVTIGKPVGGKVRVLSGLAEGEMFVPAGSFILKADLVKSAGGEE